MNALWSDKQAPVQKHLIYDECHQPFGTRIKHSVGATKAPKFEQQA